ncbi:hypothetical protein DFAR_710013 [Desulfarculales bacterium]
MAGLGRDQPIGAKREPFPSLSHLPKGAVVLAQPPGLHMGETPPWRADIGEDQKKRVAIFRYGSRLYRQGGGKLESLYPMGSNDRDGSRALNEDTAQALVRLRRDCSLRQ